MPASSGNSALPIPGQSKPELPDNQPGRLGPGKCCRVHFICCAIYLQPGQRSPSSAGEPVAHPREQVRKTACPRALEGALSRDRGSESAAWAHSSRRLPGLLRAFARPHVFILEFGCHTTWTNPRILRGGSTRIPWWLAGQDLDVPPASSNATASLALWRQRLPARLLTKWIATGPVLMIPPL